MQPHQKKPSDSLAKSVLPKPLWRAIENIFQSGVSETQLVGGTAIAGFYMGHRRSDDIDLFSKDQASFKATLASVKHLTNIGARFLKETLSNLYFHSVCELEGHRFTVDIVVDANLFKVASFEKTDLGIQIASLETLYKMKIATLVSRCSEKDLYDLFVLSQEFPRKDIEKFVSMGLTIDGGVNAENMLASLESSQLSKESCGFALSEKMTSLDIFKDIEKFRSNLIQDLIDFLQNSPPPKLASLIRKAKKLI